MVNIMEKKILKPLIVFLVVFGILIVLSFIIEGVGFTQLLFDHLGFQIGYVFWMSAVAAIIGSVVIGYALGPLFLVAHKYAIGIRMKFGIQEREHPQKLKIFLKALFPALMALNFTFMFANSPILADIIVNPEWAENSPSAQIPLVVLATLLPLMSGFAMGLFSPVFFLLDAGIVFTNKEKVRYTRDPVEVRSVGGWYHYLLKGYAGVSVIISFFLFASEVLETIHNPSVFLVAFLPLLLLIMYIPAFLIMELIVEHRKKYILKFAHKLGIKEPLDDPLKIETS